MARNRNRNRNNRNRAIVNSNTDQSISENPETSIEENEAIVNNENTQGTETPETQTEVIGDDVTNKDTTLPKQEESQDEADVEQASGTDESDSGQASEQDVTETSESEQTENNENENSEEEPVLQSDDFVVPSTEDSPKVAKLKEILKELKEALGGYGKTPEEFSHAAKISATLVEYIMANYRPEVLDALVTFYEENIDGVCRPTEFMKGSTTLGATQEQQVGLMNHLFYQLATKRFVNVNNALVIKVLKRPEISNYFQRRMVGIRANR